MTDCMDQKTEKPVPYLIPATCSLPSESGFTLVEMSVVLVVIGLIILIVYPALNAVRVSGQRSLTEANLQSLMRATAVYVQANGCLPCPTPATTIGPDFGRVRGSGTAACGACANPEGIPPFVSLGIPEHMARDGWGHWITMRVDPALTVNFNVVPPYAPCNAADVTSGACASSQLNFSQKGLCKAVFNAATNPSGINTTNRVIVQTPNGSQNQPAAVIFVSHGPNGRGAFIASPNMGATNGWRIPNSSGNELINADSNATFVNATQVIDNANPYDDSLAFLDRNNLVAYFGNGSCQTAWP